MIPPHRPAFGVGTVVTAALWPRLEARELRRCEELHATAAGCAQAVWLPSARAGIAWALRAAISPDTRVVGPAYTCSVVHEAMVRSGGRARIVDAATDSFAMERDALRAACAGNHALVLSEPFGHPCELEQLDHGVTAPRIRVVDSAMAVPHPSVFRRIAGNDFAVVSFGAGKNSYAGWGGMGYTWNPALADEVRRLRDRTLARGGGKLSWQRALTIGLRTAAQNPLVFSVARTLWYRLKKYREKSAPTSVAAAAAATEFPEAWIDDRTCSREWRLPSTRVDRALALRNLELSESVHAKRLMLARRYRENLAGATGLRLPPDSPFALSHFTVRVDAGIRNRVKELLYQQGVYTISLWAFNAHLSPQAFPNAHRLCAEVICLPLSPWMTAAQVSAICDHLRRCLARCTA